jgi:uncharacterized protein
MLDDLTAALRQAGFQYVTLDCAGFRSGSMNAVLGNEILGNAILPAEILTRRSA